MNTSGFKQLSLHLDILGNKFAVLRMASCYNSQRLPLAGIWGLRLRKDVTWGGWLMSMMMTPTI